MSVFMFILKNDAQLQLSGKAVFKMQKYDHNLLSLDRQADMTREDIFKNIPTRFYIEENDDTMFSRHWSVISPGTASTEGPGWEDWLAVQGRGWNWRDHGIRLQYPIAVCNRASNMKYIIKFCRL